MELVLEVVSYKGLPSAGGLSARFNEQGGSLGRSADNRLALPDEEKLISRHHANIRFEGGQFVLQDVSTGGTWLCHEERWLAQASAPLADGNRLKIGEYELRVRIEGAGQGEFAGLFGDLTHHTDQRPPVSYAASPVGVSFDPFSDSPTPPPLGPLPSLPSEPQAFPSLIGQPDASPFEESFSPLGILQSPAPPSLEVDFSIDNFFQEGYESPLSGQAPPPAKEDDFDLDKYLGDGLGLQEPPIAVPPAPVAESAQPALPDVFAQPEPTGTSADGDGRTAAMPESGMNAKEQARPPLPGPAEELSFGQSFEKPQPSEPAALDFPQAPSEKPASAINIPKPGRPSPAAPSASFAEPAPPIPQAPRPAPAQPMAAPPAAGDAADLFRCFLEGAGFPELSNLTPEEQKKAMQAVGMAYREMVDGLMQVLLARKMEKSMIALRQSDVTQWQPREINPLKVFVTLEETMEQMVFQKNPAYIAPAEAVREGFSDIKKHQLAMKAGMQAALDGFLRRLDPKVIEEHFKEGIVFQKKAKCWDAYCQVYPKLVNETMDDLFGAAFAEAYREQLRILRDSKY